MDNVVKSKQEANQDKRRSLLSLQAEYVRNALDLLDEAISLAKVLETTEDPTLIEEYSLRLDTLFEQITEQERIAKEIEKVLPKTQKSKKQIICR